MLLTLWQVRPTLVWHCRISPIRLGTRSTQPFLQLGQQNWPAAVICYLLSLLVLANLSWYLSSRTENQAAPRCAPISSGVAQAHLVYQGGGAGVDGGLLTDGLTCEAEETKYVSPAETWERKRGARFSGQQSSSPLFTLSTSSRPSSANHTKNLLDLQCPKQLSAS